MNIFRLVALLGAISIGCSIPASAGAERNLKLPKSQTVLNVDLNGNGKPDRIVATYFTRPVLAIANFQAHTCTTVPGKFVRYTMYADGQKNGKVIFEQDYGNTVGTYLLHQLEIGRDLDGDGRKDLVYYMGDETSNETIYLLQKSGGFKAVSGGGGASYYIDDIQKSIKSSTTKDLTIRANWDRVTEVWTSNKYGWVKGDCIAIRTQPDPRSPIVSRGFDRNLMAISNRQPVGDWIAIDNDGTSGWINKKYFSFSSPVRWFK